MEHQLSTHGLYILSGAPASGKSTWFQKALNLPAEALVSSDNLRKQIFGGREVFDPNTGKTTELLNSNGDRMVFTIMEAIVEERLKEKLVTVVDATNTTEKDREIWAKIATKHGLPTYIILFDVKEEELIQRDAKRVRSVGAEVIQHFLRKLEKTSKYPIIEVRPEDTTTFNPPTVPENTDVIGDVHGLYTETLFALNKLGYSVNNDNVLEHPDNRKVLFLGDWVDRGLQSVDCFELIHNSVTKGGHYALLGNHEHKLLKIYKHWKEKGEYNPRSFSGAETMVNFWEQVPEKKLERWMNWLNTIPGHYSCGRFVFCHADVKSLDPYQMPLSVAVYGESDWGKYDTDALFTAWSQKKGLQGPILIRGHIPNTNNNEITRAFSLEHKVGFNGIIKALPLDKVLAISESKAWAFPNTMFLNGLTPESKTEGFDLFVANTIRQYIVETKTNFDYSAHQKKATLLGNQLKELVTKNKITSERNNYDGMTIYNEGNKNMKPEQKKQLQELENRKLVSHKTNEDGLEIYKYSKRVFFDALWDESPLLLHARGLVLDAAGKIVQNPFVKIFNYGEKGAGADLADAHKVQAIEKMNGFLGCVTNHPYKKDDLLVTTTGSFDSDFVGYIRDFLPPEKVKTINEHCKETNETLMFEVIHPKDPHIIAYKDEEQGLYLIGARQKTLNAPLVSENTLDAYAEKLGVQRPKHFETTLGEIRKLADEVQHEGFIVRDLNTQEPLLKFKTSHYLTVKFIGRMGPGQTKLMFEKPEFFKQKIDEEYYPLVDLITKKTGHDQFVSLPQTERVAFVRDMVHEMWKDIHQEPTHAKKPKP